MPKRATFGELLARYRRETGVYQREIAEVAGVALASVCDWEKERRQPPSSNRLHAIAKLLIQAGLSEEKCRSLVVAAARTRGALVFDVSDDQMLRLLSAICLRQHTLNRNLVTQLVDLL